MADTITATALKVELRNVKHLESMSEETNCFTADIWVDGVKAGSASNHGHGGMTIIHPLSLAEKLEDHAKTLPPIVSNMDDPSKPGEKFTYQPRADNFIDTLVEDWLVTKDLTKLLRTKLVFTCTDKKGVFVLKKSKTPGADERLLADANWRRREKVNQVLNELPLEEALKLYRTA